VPAFIPTDSDKPIWEWLGVNASNEMHADIAYDEDHDRYLVVFDWDLNGTGDHDIIGVYVDAYGNTIYVNRDGQHLDVYQVTLHDTDGDGVLEPDQHLDNPSATGPMEQRTLSYVKTYNIQELDSATRGELYATAGAVYFLGVDEGAFWSQMQSSIDFYDDILNGVIKSLVFGFVVTWISLFEGYDAIPTSEGVSRATTRTVVYSSFAILGMDFILTALMFGDI
jgi:hypothetical protein